ncbi:MAG: biotin/lipoyl-containing protein [Candidatus Bathyarchaeia archaeon]
MTFQEVLVNKKPYKIRVLERNGSSFLVEVDGKTFSVAFRNSGQGKAAVLEINGKTFSASVNKVYSGFRQVVIDGKLFDVQFQPKILRESTTQQEPMFKVVKKPAAGLIVGKDAVTAPISGRIVSLKANIGRKIEKGACICVLEAMKMQNLVVSHKAGIVKEIRVSAGAVVNKGDVLAIIS